ncbi:MAG TPA: hypothetical protein VFI27_02200 [candidate division Zixibacteria bacterium]|nr:hypothetical protein [candidate division Zixibacteria bacterium]
MATVGVSADGRSIETSVVVGIISVFAADVVAADGVASDGDVVGIRVRVESAGGVGALPQAESTSNEKRRRVMIRISGSLNVMNR